MFIFLYLNIQIVSPSLIKKFNKEIFLTKKGDSFLKLLYQAVLHTKIRIAHFHTERLKRGKTYLIWL